jgi:transcriptional regulator with PAS, ATPase and Fis domain
MLERISFVVENLPNVEAGVNLLNELLSRIGITVELTYHENESSEVGYFVLDFSFDNYNVMNKLTRNAGRKRKQDQNPENMTWGEVIELMKSNSAQNVASRLNISRDTLYKRLRSRPENSRNKDIF